MLPWSQLEKVTIDGSVPPFVRVMKERKVLPWSRVSLAKVHNSVRLLEELATRGVVIDPGPHAFVSRGLFERLVSAEMLPRAEIVRR